MPNLEAFDSVVSDSRISVSRKIGAVEDSEMVNIIPSVSTRTNLVCWHSWSPTGLTTLTLDTTRLLNKPTLGDIYNALATTCNTIQHFEYVGLIACIDAASGRNIRTRLVFPELYSLAVLSHDDMVPLLRLMVIPALDSLILRDSIAYPHIPTIPDSYLTYVDEVTEGLAFDPAGLFRIIEEWKSITHLEIFGIDNLPSDPSLPPPDLLNYLKTLNQLSSLVLFGDGVATSIAIVLFANNLADSEEPLLLPQLSHFLLAVNHDEMANDDLCDYIIARHRHNLPRLQMLTVNGEYIQYLVDLNRINILWESSDDIFVITDPEYGDYNSMDRVNLVERIPRE